MKKKRSQRNQGKKKRRADQKNRSNSSSIDSHASLHHATNFHPDGTVPSSAVAIIAALLFVAVVGVYLQSRTYDFIYDDHKLVVQQSAPTDVHGYMRLFAERHWDNLPYYRPIPRLTMAIQKALHGNNPAPFHLFNAVLIGLMSLAAFWLLRTRCWKIATPIALAGAAIFVVHPIASCTVYPICSGRETLLPGILFVLAVACWIRKQRAYYIAAIFLLACALFSKEQSIVLPVLFLAADLLKISSTDRPLATKQLLVRFIPVVVVTLIYLAIRQVIFDGSAEHQLAIFEKPLGPLHSLLFAIQSSLFPFLELRYEPDFANWFRAWRSISGLLLVAVIIAIWSRLTSAVSRHSAAETRINAASEEDRIDNDSSKRRKVNADNENHANNETVADYPSAKSVFIFWILWIGLTLAPTANILKQEAAFAERYVFLALLGIVAIVAMTISRLLERAIRLRKIIYGGSCLVVVILAIITIQRGKYFANDQAFFAQWIAYDPQSEQAIVSLGGLALENDDFEQATEYFATALQQHPNSAIANHGVGLLLLRQEKPFEALPYLERAVSLKYNYAEAHNNYGWALSLNGNKQAAISEFETAIEQMPHFAEAYTNLGRTLEEIAQAQPPDWTDYFDRAEEAYRTAIAVNPQFAKGHFGLGRVMAIRGDIRAAADRFERATQLAPDFADAFENLGRAKNLLGEKAAAIDAYERALQLNPSNEGVRATLEGLTR